MCLKNSALVRAGGMGGMPAINFRQRVAVGNPSILGNKCSVHINFHLFEKLETSILQLFILHFEPIASAL